MASKKGKKVRSRARKGGGAYGRVRRSRRSGSASMGGVSLFFVGAIILFGGVILSKLCKLPYWLSPVGAALWLVGWWKNNAFLRTLGLLYIGTGLGTVMGLPDQASKKLDEAAKAEGGFLGNLFTFQKTTGPAPRNPDRGGSSNPVENVTEAIDNVVSVIDAGQRGYNAVFA